MSQESPMPPEHKDLIESLDSIETERAKKLDAMSKWVNENIYHQTRLTQFEIDKVNDSDLPKQNKDSIIAEIQKQLKEKIDKIKDQSIDIEYKINTVAREAVSKSGGNSIVEKTLEEVKKDTRNSEK